eukprot:TRINITY_DN1370_c0_g1_i2.p1 TRINITY_DN1370_c0_g1~~TRINITY_DN1370_c0_g1_i2.p1  ORF type:complete len:177 (+),score=33.58 TRINITY_DN1370_c0_g1_i2:564-1094(+)
MPAAAEEPSAIRKMFSKIQDAFGRRPSKQQAPAAAAADDMSQAAKVSEHYAARLAKARGEALSPAAFAKIDLTPKPTGETWNLDFRGPDGFDLDYETLLQLEDVPCGLTPQQLAKIPKRSWAQSDEASCRVCLYVFEAKEVVRALPCKHTFHSECIDQWFALKQTCPCCLANLTRL